MCASPNCDKPATGKSKYCDPHKAQAREAWKAMIAAKSGDKAEREANHQALFDKAHKAGVAAAEATTPTPMIVFQHEHPLDDSSPVVKVYEPIADGVCGFAWIKVTPGNSSFALWLKKIGKGRSAYQGGVSVYVHDYRQSLTLKEAYAQAFAAVLRESGLRAYAGSRMD